MEFTIYFILNNYILSLIILKLSKKSISSRKKYSLCIEKYKNIVWVCNIYNTIVYYFIIIFFYYYYYTL